VTKRSESYHEVNDGLRGGLPERFKTGLATWGRHADGNAWLVCGCRTADRLRRAQRGYRNRPRRSGSAFSVTRTIGK
jgi:hypothetical protein